MNRKLLHLVFAAALSGTAALGVASDSDFVADEIRGLHSELADTRRWVDSDIRANLAHRWETIPNRLAERGFGWAETELESLSWIPNADLAVESDSAGRLSGFSVGGTGLLWTGESAAVGFQPWGRWTDGGENDAASFGIFSRRALGDWGVVGGNVFADYAANGEFGDFARWSAGLDFQSALGELRGNYYAGLSSTRERVGLENRVLAYAPSGVDAELRLRWFGDSEWSGFAEYEKWAGQFGDSDLEEVGYGLSFRPVGGGLLAGLQVDAGFRDSADSAGRWDLRLGYSRRLGADDSVRNSGSAFAVRSALVSPVAREREIDVRTAELSFESARFSARKISVLVSGDYTIVDFFDTETGATVFSYIYAVPSIRSDAKGILFDMNIPELPNAEISINVFEDPHLYTIVADNQLSLVPGAKLLRQGVSGIFGYLHVPGREMPYQYELYPNVEDVRAPIVWTSPPIRKAVDGYTGDLFTVTIVPAIETAGFSYGVSAAFAIDFNGWQYQGIGEHEILHYNYVPKEFWDENQNVFGRYTFKEVVAFVRRPIRVFSPVVAVLHSEVAPTDYALERLTMAFTIAAIAKPEPISVGLAMGQTGDIYTLSADVEGLTFLEYGLSEKLSVSPKGVVRVNPAIKLEEGLHTITVRATSPNLLGELEFVVYAFVECKSQREGGVSPFDSDRIETPANKKLYQNANLANVQAVCEALRAGANPNYGTNKNADGTRLQYSVLGYMAGSPYSQATAENLEIVARLLLQAGADPNALAHGAVFPDRDGSKLHTTALHLAAKQTFRFAGYVRMLLAYGANPNLRNRNYLTPLHHSADLSGGDAEIFNLLLNATGNLDQKNSSINCYVDDNPCPFETVLHRVGRQGDEYRFAKMLNRSANAAITNRADRTPCDYEVDCVDARSLATLLDTGFGVNQVDIFGLAPLHYAALDKKLSLVKDLVKISGANPKIKTTEYYEDRNLDSGATPLDFVSGTGGLSNEIRRVLREAVRECEQNQNSVCNQ